jgi:hypothetical protein
VESVRGQTFLAQLPALAKPYLSMTLLANGFHRQKGNHDVGQ